MSNTEIKEVLGEFVDEINLTNIILGYKEDLETEFFTFSYQGYLDEIFNPKPKPKKKKYRKRR